mgnify:CR=1 FL=1
MKEFIDEYLSTLLELVVMWIFVEVMMTVTNSFLLI